MTGIVNSTGARSGVIGTTVGTPATTDTQTTAKAWVNYKGTPTNSIRASFNVSSVTDNALGDYTVNFATAMSDTLYTTFGSSIGNSSGWHSHPFGSYTPTTASIRVIMANPNTSMSLQDIGQCNIVVFGA